MPCPICEAGTCTSGENAGNVCTPGSADLGALHPTSYDCPPTDMHFVGPFALPLVLDTAAATWTASPATNDTGLLPEQARVFCGYCRDDDGTNAFQSPPQACWEQGMAVGPACAQPFETCQQRDEGAFGPNGTNVRTISTAGLAAGSLADHAPHPAKFGAVFCIPPSLNPTAGGAFGLPGPGAIGLNATMQVQ